MKFSCYICAYNPNKEWLNEAISSCTGLFDQLVIVDNGSIEPIENATVRIEENIGRWHGRNSAVQHCTGDIIFALDCDDVFIPEAVKRFKEYLVKSKSDLWYTPIWMFGAVEKVVAGNSDPLTRYDKDHIVPCGNFFRKSVWEDIGGYKNIEAEDWLLWIEAIRKGKSFEYFDEPVYKYRIHSNSSTFNWNKDLARRLQELQMKLDILSN